MDKRTEFLRGDWFDDAVAESEQLRKEYLTSQRSAEWSSSVRSCVENALIGRTLQAARNVARNHGVPRNTVIRLASIGDIGAGAAGFHDAPDQFRQPFILLDRSAYHSCCRDEVMDVYCGIALHEAGHILHTRDGYRRLFRPDRDTLLNSLDNLLEDDRIEHLVCLESPGYAPYIEAARQKLLQGGAFGQAMREWESLPDPEKPLALIGSFVRTPQLIRECAMCWRAPNDECVFDTLRQLLPVRPSTEADVDRMANDLHDLFKRISRLYPADPNIDGATGPESKSDCDAEATGSAESESAPQRPRVGRFAPSDLDAALGAWGTVNDVFDEGEISLAQMEADEFDQEACVIATENWRWSNVARQVVVELASSDGKAQQRYHEARARIGPSVVAMKAALPSGGATRRISRRELRAGRLDPRRIALAPVSPRIFRSSTSTHRSRVAIGLLLDASGSMRGTRVEVALDAAVLITEAFADDDRVDLHVFSHTSLPDDDTACLVRTHYGPAHRCREAVGAYYAGDMNYDHCAIQTCERLLRQSAAKRTRQRFLIVVSDGHPHGVDYESTPAVEATAKAVNEARAAGTVVIGIGIDGHHCDDIYSDRWHINIEDCNDLPAQLRSLLVRLTRGG